MNFEIHICTIIRLTRQLWYSYILFFKWSTVSSQATVVMTTLIGVSILQNMWNCLILMYHLSLTVIAIMQISSHIVIESSKPITSFHHSTTIPRYSRSTNWNPINSCWVVVWHRCVSFWNGDLFLYTALIATKL